MASNTSRSSAPHGSSGLKACEQQSRHHKKCHYDARGVRWRGEEDSERGQNEQGSHRLDSPSRIFVQRSFTAEPLCCGGIVSMAVGPSHAIVQTSNASSGGAIHTVIPIQKRKSFSASAIASANTRWVVVFTTVLTTRRGAPAPRRVATREASKLHPADGW